MLRLYFRRLTSFTNAVNRKRLKKFSTYTNPFLKPNVNVAPKCLKYSTRIFELDHSRENSYAFGILQTIPVVDKDLFSFTPAEKPVDTMVELDHILDQNWRDRTASEIVAAFKSICSFCNSNLISVTDKRFDKLVDGLMDRVQDLTDHELSDLLTCISKLPPCETYKAHNFHDIWSALDDVCCWRIANWSRETTFWFAELWYKSNLVRFSDYIYFFIMRLERRISKCTKEELLHLYFYMHIKRRKSMPFEFQNQLDLFIGDMSLNEITVAMTSLARNKIKPKFVTTCETVIKRLKENPKADEPIVSNIMQVLRYSSHVLLVDQLMDLLDHLVPEIDRLSITGCVHLALLGTTLQFFHKESLLKIGQKVAPNLSQTRMKEMERVLVAFTMFDFAPRTTPDIFQGIMDEIHQDERRIEIELYARCLRIILNFLSLRNMYSYKLMDEIFQFDNISTVYGKRPRELGTEMFCLDVSREIECPDYEGNRLDRHFRHKVTKWHVEYIPQWNQTLKLTWTDKLHLEIRDLLVNIVPDADYIHCGHIIPSYVKADIIVCRDEHGFVKPAGFEQYALGDVLYPPNKNLKWYTIIPLNSSMTIRGTSKPLGVHLAKHRMLKKIGYEPVFIIANEFVLLHKEGKLRYLAEKLGLSRTV